MKIALIYLLVGVFGGVVVGAGKHIVFVFKGNRFVQIICDLIITIAVILAFVYLNHFFFYGEIRLHLILFFALGMYIERKTFGKLFAKLFLILYNGVSKGLKSFKSTALGKFITK